MTIILIILPLYLKHLIPSYNLCLIYLLLPRTYPYFFSQKKESTYLTIQFHCYFWRTFASFWWMNKIIFSQWFEFADSSLVRRPLLLVFLFFYLIMSLSKKENIEKLILIVKNHPILNDMTLQCVRTFFLIDLYIVHDKHRHRHRAADNTTLTRPCISHTRHWKKIFSFWATKKTAKRESKCGILPKVQIRFENMYEFVIFLTMFLRKHFFN